MTVNFICILGIDGSGKSTLAYNLINEFEHYGEKWIYVWGGCKHYLTFPLILLGRTLWNLNPGHYQDHDKYLEEIQKRSRNTLISSIYYHTLILDYYLQILFKIRIPLLFGRKIITDRYIFGTMIDMAVNLGFEDSRLKTSIENSFSFIPKPDFVFLIDIPEEIAFQRKEDIPSINYLKSRRLRYLHLPSDFDIDILDGGNSPMNLAKICVDKIKSDRKQ